MKITYKTWLMRINMEGWMVYLVRFDCDISSYYDQRHDHLRNQWDDTVIDFPSNCEPPDIIKWHYENDSTSYS